MISKHEPKVSQFWADGPEFTPDEQDAITVELVKRKFLTEKKEPAKGFMSMASTMLHPDTHQDVAHRIYKL